MIKETQAQTEFRELAFEALARNMKKHAIAINDLIRQAVVVDGGEWTAALAVLKERSQ